MISFISILAYALGAQKNRPIETVVLSTLNICFGFEIRKNNLYVRKKSFIRSHVLVSLGYIPSLSRHWTKFGPSGRIVSKFGWCQNDDLIFPLSACICLKIIWASTRENLEGH